MVVAAAFVVDAAAFVVVTAAKEVVSGAGTVVEASAELTDLGLQRLEDVSRFLLAILSWPRIGKRPTLW